MTIQVSRYPTLSVQFNARFVTHDDKPEIPAEGYVISHNPNVPGAYEHTNAVAAVLGALNPPFPAA